MLSRSKTRRSLALISCLLIALASGLSIVYTGCAPACKMTVTPDELQRFNEIVPMADLRDSLSEGTLVPGMPYITVCSLLVEGCSGTIRKEVAGIGSRVGVREFEGISRAYAVQTEFYLDVYKTDRGKLALWMQRPDFYLVAVETGDIVQLYWRDPGTDTIVVGEAEVDYLETPSRLVFLDRIHNIPGDASVDCRIRHMDNPQRTHSFWYGLELVRSGDTQMLIIPRTGRSYLNNPIEWLELNRHPVESFKWR